MATNDVTPEELLVHVNGLPWKYARHDFNRDFTPEPTFSASSRLFHASLQIGAKCERLSEIVRL
jgi:hypothetical protein